MTVFLRWGVFALLTIAALIYAYRVNERSSDITARLEAQRVQSARLPAAEGGSATPPPLPADCAGELRAVEAAAASAARGEPLDRVLRRREIAFETDPAEKARLTLAANRGFAAPGADATERAAIARAACEAPTT